MEEQVKIKLGKKEYMGRLDFLTIVRIQNNLRKLYDFDLKFNEVFKEIDNQNLAVILEVVVQSILRVHGQIKRERIEDAIGLRDTDTLMTFIYELVGQALPNEEA